MAALQCDLKAIRNGRSGTRAAELAGVYTVIGSISRSVWTPIVAPIVTAVVATVRHPEINKRGRAADPLDRSLEIPIAEHPSGPMTRARHRHLLALLGTAQVAGLAAAASKAPPNRQAFAVGMMVPGGGFLYTRDPALFVVTLAAFAFSVLL
jgi:hypothetical protein